MNIDRWPGSAAGRSRASGYDGLLWLVANATDPGADFRTQVGQTLAALDGALRGAGSGRSRLLSVQVLLADIGAKPVFDELWQAWIGPDPAAWPQRSCFQVVLTPGLLVEITAVAARG
jgi:enamine deaminase RidA (YjgF/YER057c/UK114 family)